MGTMCRPVLDFLKKEKAHKGVVFVLNKVDLVPTWVTVRSLPLRLLPRFLSLSSLPSPIPSPSLHTTFQVKAFCAHLPRELCKPDAQVCYKSGRANLPLTYSHPPRPSWARGGPQSPASVLEDG